MNVLTEFGKIAEQRVYELRIVGVDGRKRVDSGYFDDIALLAQAAGRYDNRASGIYTTVNEVDPALFARSANKMQQSASNLTGDADIVRRRWLLVDLDPKRPGGISSTDAQHRAAHDLAVTIAGELAQSGWPAPVHADSGNGAHLLWRIDWPNSPDVAAAIQGWLAQLNDRYGSAEMSVDRTVYNASRIWKLYGTWARKGSSTADRPHRQSRVLHVGDDVLLDAALFAASQSSTQSSVQSSAFSAVRLDAARRSASEPAAQGSFDVHDFMQAHFPAAEPQNWNGGTKWVLDQCPWDPAHTDRSAFVAVLPSGAISAGCHHNGCAGKDWRALRTLMARPERALYANGNHATVQTVQTVQAVQTVQTVQAVQTVQTVQTDALPKTPDEGGLADLWIAQHRTDRVWAVGWESWMLWSGTRWRRDEGLTVRSEIDDMLVSANAAAEQMVAAAGNDRALARQAGRFVTATARKAQRVRGIEQLAQPRLTVHSREFDQRNLLNLENGTLDLDTFEFREHRPSDRLTSVMDYSYDENATHPRWSAFLRQVLVDEDGRHDEDLARLLQELVGYSLTTHTYMQTIVFQRGDGGNGKSVVTGTLSSLLGDLAVHVEFERLGEPGNHDLARIPGRRALISTESKKGINGPKRIPEDVLKRLSDGEPLVSNQKYEVPFEYRPVGKIWWSMNHMPRVTDTTASIWRRLQVLPYNHTISEAEKDVRLPSKLHAERSGILNWALIGLERVASRRQFTTVAQVTHTVDEYRRGSDPVGMFVDDCCHTEPAPGRTELWTAAGALFEAYTEWSRRNQFERLGYLSARDFANEMKRLGYPGKRHNTGMRYPVLIRIEAPNGA